MTARFRIFILQVSRKNAHNINYEIFYCKTIVKQKKKMIEWIVIGLVKKKGDAANCSYQVTG